MNIFNDNNMYLEKATNFFTKWREINNRENDEIFMEKANKFFLEWRNLNLPKKEKEFFFTPEKIAKLQDFFMNFPDAFKRYKASGAMINVWQIAKLKNDEVRNTSVLAWFLDEKGEHGQGSGILEQLLDEIGEVEFATIVRGKPYRCQTEVNPLGDIESRVDIEIEGKEFLIFIEAKINAGETNNQLERYLKILPKKANGRKTLVLYLTKNGKNPKNTNLCEQMHPISWKQIANAMHKYVKSKNIGGSLPANIIEQFAIHIQSF